MALLPSIRDHHSERRLFVSRVLLAVFFCVLLSGTVVARLVQLQIVHYDQYTERALGNRIRTQPVAPIRGLILDRNDTVLAQNLPAFQLELIPEQVDDIDETLERLAEHGFIRSNQIESLADTASRMQRFRALTLNSRLTEEQISRFAVERVRFPGVDFKPRLVRDYPHKEALAHVVGYVSKLSVDDMRDKDATRYAGTTQGGKTGVESSFESLLHGHSGFRHLVTNARGREIATDTAALFDALPDNQLPAPGDNLLLTLDIDLQLLAYELMANRRGAVVALNPNNGNVLAMLSSPSFDPNKFSLGMTNAEFADITLNPDLPLFNRAVRGIYPPGSTIKPIIALAALETGATNLTRKSMCRGWYSLPNNEHRYRDWKPEGHGEVDIHSSIAQSCDVYFYEISTELGIDRMHDYLDRFGLGKQTGVEIGGERAGIVPSSAWKRANFRGTDRRWYDGESVIASIGQGYMTATPIQLASATAALAMRGERYRPRLIRGWQDPISGNVTETEPERLAAATIDNEFYWNDVIDAMNAVLQSPRGTAWEAGKDAPYRMAGKSGTAQVFSVAQEEEYNEEEIEERLRDHALFVSFAPLEAPEIVVAVIVENGSSGSRVAAPIARAIMDQHLGYARATE